jgi:hypothetical protein
MELYSWEGAIPMGLRGQAELMRVASALTIAKAPRPLLAAEVVGEVWEKTGSTNLA